MRLITRPTEVEVEVEGVKVKGKLLSTAEKAAIRQRHYVDVKRKWKDEATGEEGEKEITILDPDRYTRELFIASITDLGETAVNEAGERLECNDKNLGLIFDFNEGWAVAAIQKIAAKIVEIRKGDLKNSLRGGDGTLSQTAQVVTSAVN